MAGKEFKTRSGARVFVTHAAFEDGVALKKAVEKVMLDLSLIGKPPSRETTLRLFGDPDVYACYQRCAAKATYNDSKIDAALFDDPKTGESASGDLEDIFDMVVSFNLQRFFRAASSASSAPPPAA